MENNIPTALFNTSASNATNGTISAREIDPGPPPLPRRSFLRRLGLGAALLAPGSALIGSASEAFGDHEHDHHGDPHVGKNASGCRAREQIDYSRCQSKGGNDRA